MCNTCGGTCYNPIVNRWKCDYCVKPPKYKLPKKVQNKMLPFNGELRCASFDDFWRCENKGIFPTKYGRYCLGCWHENFDVREFLYELGGRMQTIEPPTRWEQRKANWRAWWNGW